MARIPFKKTHLFFLIPLAAVIAAILYLGEEGQRAPPKGDDPVPGAQRTGPLPVRADPESGGEAAAEMPRVVGPGRPAPQPGGLSIEGSVLDENHRGFRHIIVIADFPGAPDHGRIMGSPRHWARTDEKGRFRIDALDDTEYRITVFGTPGYLQPPPPLVRGGAREVTIVLSKAPTFTIRVTGPDGLPVRKFRVNIIDPDGVHRWRVGTNGLQKRTGLDPNLTYTLRVVPDSKLRLRPVEIRDWSPGDIDVKLKRGGRVSGTVVGPDGERVQGSLVWWREEGSVWRSAEFYDRGKFICRDVLSDEVTLRAGLKGSLIEDADVVEVTAKNGAEDVVLPVDPGLPLEVLVEGSLSTLPAKAVLLDESAERVRRIGNRFRGSGWFAFRGLKPDRTYTFMLVGAGDRAALVRGLRPEDRSVTVKLRPGLSIQGRVRLPAEGTWATAIATQNGLSCNAGIDKTGHFKIDGLTAGRWRVTVFARRDGLHESLTGEAIVEAGDSANIELRPAR